MEWLQQFGVGGRQIRRNTTVANHTTIHSMVHILIIFYESAFALIFK